MIIATLGTSFITDDLIEAFQHNNIEVRYCYGRNIENTRKFALKHNILNAINNYDELLVKQDFDTVYIALPNALHYEYALKALNNHKNVILEKPFCSNVKQSEELFSLAKKHNLCIVCAATPLFLKAYQDIKEHLKSIIRLKLVYFNFSKYSSRYDAFLNGENPNNFNPLMDGGALMDLNVYNLYAAIILFGKPKECTYIANVENNIDTSGVIILKYDGFICNLVAGKDCNMQAGLEISGDKTVIKSDMMPSLINSYYVNDKLYQTHDHNYNIETKIIKELFDNEDFSELNKLNQITLDVMEVLDKLRKEEK